MKKVFIESQDKHVAIGGCKLPKHTVGLKLKDFLHATLPASPASTDYSAKAMSVLTNIEGNDALGDCVFAEDAHYIGVVTGNANTLFSYTVAQTIKDYSAFTGYVPGDPSTDQGADPVETLNGRVTKGYADGSKDAGWALVDGANQAEVEYAINTFGNLKMWFGIPDAIVNDMPNASGFVWDTSAGSADENNGHCIGSCGYSPTQFVGVTAKGPLVMTWGMLGIVTWAALSKWFTSNAGGGLAVRVTTDWINKASGSSPSGLNLSALVTAFNLYLGGKLVVPPPAPSPAPVPVPSPGPTTSVTLAQAQALAAAGINKGYPLLTRAQAIADANAGLAAGWPKP